MTRPWPSRQNGSLICPIQKAGLEPAIMLRVSQTMSLWARTQSLWARTQQPAFRQRWWNTGSADLGASCTGTIYCFCVGGENGGCLRFRKFRVRREFPFPGLAGRGSPGARVGVDGPIRPHALEAFEKRCEPPTGCFTFGLRPADAVRRLRKAGSLVFQTVTNPNEAEQAAAIGDPRRPVPQEGSTDWWFSRTGPAGTRVP